ncbi:MAG: M48 family metalloprotease [Candidatus Omnitrophica bacterium]|nr:M48 family metalloprotease [Candidatus Omnitrophota bacterium]
MRRAVWVVIAIFAVISGCSRLTQNEIISPYLPVSLEDIEEIRVGDEAHKALFESQNPYQAPKYKLYTIPELHAYVSYIGKKIAQVSERPNLPYRFFILDSDDIDLFGLPGGRIYITRGFFYFIDSEAELAGALAHEIGHIANRDYKPEGYNKVRKGYDLVLKGAQEGSGLAGTYGSAAYAGVRAIGYASPRIRNKFKGNDEEEADADAVFYMTKAGFDPKGLYRLTDRLSKVPVEDVGRFVDYMKGHPPDQDRRNFLQKKTRKLKFTPKPLYRVTADHLTVVPGTAEIVIKSQAGMVGDGKSGQEDVTAVPAAAIGTAT